MTFWWEVSTCQSRRLRPAMSRRRRRRARRAGNCRRAQHIFSEDIREILLQKCPLVSFLKFSSSFHNCRRAQHIFSEDIKTDSSSKISFLKFSSSFHNCPCSQHKFLEDIKSIKSSLNYWEKWKTAGKELNIVYSSGKTSCFQLLLNFLIGLNICR